MGRTDKRSEAAQQHYEEEMEKIHRTAAGITDENAPGNLTTKTLINIQEKADHQYESILYGAASGGSRAPNK